MYCVLCIVFFVLWATVSEVKVSYLLSEWTLQQGVCYDKFSPSEGCNRNYTGESGRVRSPGWPGYYPPGKVCDISVVGPEGSSVALFFNAFDIENHRNCQYDHLQVRGRVILIVSE